MTNTRRQPEDKEQDQRSNDLVTIGHEVSSGASSALAPPRWPHGGEWSRTSALFPRPPHLNRAR